MLNAFLDAFRTRTFHLLQKAYTSLPLPLAQTYLGLSAEEVLTCYGELRLGIRCVDSSPHPIPRFYDGAVCKWFHSILHPRNLRLCRHQRRTLGILELATRHHRQLYHSPSFALHRL
ncbi:hypothetical protein C8F01DRAFT_8182 [Mycena amicta]|nr:hypothetical protein C8F01DRAFT_8182 [Mycena amicta]